MKGIFSLLGLLSVAVVGAKHHHHHHNHHHKHHHNPKHSGSPLDVSALLRSGSSAAECREAARVVDLPTLPKGVDAGYSGYFTVDASTGARGEGGKMFWWYFPPQSAPESTDAPTLLWLQGGPGGSSLYGLFAEMGPIKVGDDGKLQANPFTWNKDYGMLFIDNPLGAGFSHAASNSSYVTNEDEVAENLHAALQDFYRVFPELAASSDFYVTGESYGGHYVPAIAYRIAFGGVKAGEVKIPLKGIAIGDGWVDPVNMVPYYGGMMYNLGLADGPQIDVIDRYTKAIVGQIRAENYTKAFRLWDEMLNGDLFPYPNYFHNVTDSSDYDNFQRINAPASFGYYSSFLNRKDVRRAIHAGDDTPYGGNAKDCEKALVPDFMVSMLPRVKRLLEEAKLPILVYVGQLDIIIGTPLVAGWLNAFEWEGAEAYRNNARGVWRSMQKDTSADPQQGKDPVFGYYRSAQPFPLTFVTVRGAGHILPADAPVQALDMITRFVEKVPFSKGAAEGELAHARVE